MTLCRDRRVLDVSRPVSHDTAGWPGDVPYTFTQSWRMAAGASVNVGAVSGSVHTATHCDAPYHFDDAGATVDRLPLDAFLGPAWVVDVGGSVSWQARLEGSDLSAAPRVLFRTGGWPDTSRFPASIPVMEPTLPGWLAARGVVLIGVDVPSVDALDSKTLDNHYALGRAGVAIVEGLWLDGVRPGLYDFVGLPLRLVGADGSPLRAALIAAG